MTQGMSASLGPFASVNGAFAARVFVFGSIITVLVILRVQCRMPASTNWATVSGSCLIRLWRGLALPSFSGRCRMRRSGHSNRIRCRRNNRIKRRNDITHSRHINRIRWWRHSHLTRTHNSVVHMCLHLWIIRHPI